MKPCPKPRACRIHKIDYGGFDSHEAFTAVENVAEFRPRETVAHVSCGGGTHVSKRIRARCRQRPADQSYEFSEKRMGGDADGDRLFSGRYDLRNRRFFRENKG